MTNKAPTKKVAAKKVVEKAAPAKTVVKPEPVFGMPQEVKDWIDRAHSIMNHQRGEIERLKEENKELKAYKAWASSRLTRSEHRD